MPNELKSWSYDLRSGWSEIEDTLWSGLPDDTGLEDALKQAGYKDDVITLGQMDSSVYLEVYAKDAQVPGPRYFISLELSGRGENIYVANLPSLLALLKDFAPLLQAGLLRELTSGYQLLDLLAQSLQK